MLKWSLVVGTGAAAGSAFVGWTVYEQAKVDVDERLAGAVWGPSGRVLSGPLEVWPGLRLGPEELARDLQAAGYARVERPSRAGDFAVSGADVVVQVPRAEGPGWTVKAQDVQRYFDTSGVQTYIINGSRVIFLRDRPQPKPTKTLNACKSCKRACRDQFCFCSLCAGI